MSPIFRSLLSSFPLLSSHFAPAYSLPVQRSVSGPVLTNFPDPSIIKVGDTWYAFGTTNLPSQTIHVQMASSNDFDTWNPQTGQDALATLPAWVDTGNPQVWAPDVIQRDDGSFVMYFSATTSTNTALHCVGAATSSSIQGPYTASSEPWVCPLAQGGAIDASGFRDADGSRYVVYKVDGNSMGRPTPIMIQKVQEDGVTTIGDPIQILVNDANDGPVVEAPSLARSSEGKYFLFFSSNIYTSPQYDVTWATASSVTGPYTKRGPLFVTGTNGLSGPGGADIDADGQHMAFHGNVGDSRDMFTALVKLSGDDVQA